MDDWIFEIIEQGGYAGIFFLMFAETLFPPIPSEVVMPVAGVSASNGVLSLDLVIAAGTAGAMTGNLFWYGVARSLGLGRLRLLIRRYGHWLAVGWSDIATSNRLFRAYGSVFVLIGRALPTIRTIVSLPAGIARMDLAKYLAWSTIGTAIWSGGLTLIGYELGNRVDRVEAIIGPVALAVAILIASAYVWRQLTWRRARHNVQTDA